MTERREIVVKKEKTSSKKDVIDTTSKVTQDVEEDIASVKESSHKKEPIKAESKDAVTHDDKVKPQGKKIMVNIRKLFNRKTGAS